MPYEPVLMGSLVVCRTCAERGVPLVIPRVYVPRHDAWHDRQAQAEEPVLERAS